MGASLFRPTELGLVKRQELLIRKSSPQTVFQRHPLDSAGCQVRRIELVAVAAAGLGAIHGAIGIANQLIAIIGVGWIQADANACAN